MANKKTNKANGKKKEKSAPLSKKWSEQTGEEKRQSLRYASRIGGIVLLVLAFFVNMSAMLLTVLGITAMTFGWGLIDKLRELAKQKKEK